MNSTMQIESSTCQQEMVVGASGGVVEASVVGAHRPSAPEPLLKVAIAHSDPNTVVNVRTEPSEMETVTTPTPVVLQPATTNLEPPRVLNVMATQPQPKPLNSQPQKTLNNNATTRVLSNLPTGSRLVGNPKFQVVNNLVVNKAGQQRPVAVQKVTKSNNNMVPMPNAPGRIIANQKLVKPVTNVPKQALSPHKTIKTIPAQTVNNANYLKTTGIKTIPAQVNNLNKVQSPVKMVPNANVNARAGLKTLAPQRPIVNNRPSVVAPPKPNYIGKHAVQAHKSQQQKVSPVKRPAPGTVRPATTVPPTLHNVVKYQNKAGGAPTPPSYTQSPPAPVQAPPPPPAAKPEHTYPSSNEDSLSLTEDIGEEVTPAILPNMSYLSQVIMLDHNYVAAPPEAPRRTPSPPPHQPPATSQNGAPAPPPTAPPCAPAKPPYSTTPNALSYSRPGPTSESLGYRGDEQSDSSSVEGPSAAADRAALIDEGEETETAPEGEGDDTSITTCICDYDHDDGWMIQCDVCSSWQHVKCMYPSIAPGQKEKLPDKYYCVRCQPRPVDRALARAAQQRFALHGKHDQSPGTPAGTGTTASTPPDHRLAALRHLHHHHRDVTDDSDTSTADSGAEGDGDEPLSHHVHQARRKHSLTLNNNVVGKKRGTVSARRKSEPAGRRAPLHSKRRRESARDTPASAARRSTSVSASNALKKRDKKSLKRKVKSRASLDEDSQDSWPANSGYSGAPNLVAGLYQLRQWIENYEEAVTNHYSPELRARIISSRANGAANAAAPPEKQAPPNASQEAQLNRCKVVKHSLASVRMLVATQPLNQNSTVIELMGKYMLSTQHRTAPGGGSGSGGSGGSGGAGSTGGGPLARHTRPGPFLFFYRLPRDGPEVCVDTRTYGNNARFIRRSCKPNAELRHCIEKGALHLYVVTLTNVEKNAELTIKHESHDLAAAAAAAAGLGSPSTTSLVMCACGNPHSCGLYTHHRKNGGATSPDRSTTTPSNTSTTITTTTSSSAVAITTTLPSSGSPNNRRRGRRNTSATRTESPPPAPPAHSPGNQNSSGPPALSTRRASQQSRLNSQASSLSREHLDKEDYKVEKSSETKDKKRKLTREERKMEAIVKAFEKMEKAQMRKMEVQARQAQRRESESGTGSTKHHENGDMERDGLRTRRKKRKGRTRTISTNSLSSSRRRGRLNSTDSYVSSGEDNSLLSPPLPSGGGHDSGSNTDKHSPTTPDHKLKDEDMDIVDETAIHGTHNEMNSPGQVNTAAGLLLALANAGNGAADPNIAKSPEIDGSTSGSSSSNHSLQDPPLSSACLLVAAAVERLEPDFKFPKTKKQAIMNEWLNKSPEPVAQASLISPIPMQTSNMETDMNMQQMNSDYYNSTMSTSNKSLATLVQAANSLGDSPPQSSRAPVSTGPCQPQHQVQQGVGNAKKRWLRQAISEECDSPSSRPESPPSSTEIVVAPPKKRRLARESLSSEQSFTPPNTPTMLVPPTNSLVEEEFPNNDEEFYTNDERNTVGASPPTTEFTKMETQDTARPVLHMEQSEQIIPEKSTEIRVEFSNQVPSSKDIEEPTPRKYPEALSGSLLDPRLGRDRPLFRDSAQLLGTVEKTIRFYEENLTGSVSPVVTTPGQEDVKEKAPKPEMVTPAKRKLSISEYRQRKQLTTTGERAPSPEITPSAPSQPSAPAPVSRPRSNSTSSTTSSLSSDDEPPTPHADTKITPTAEPQVAVAFNSAPTTVERQRENVERLKKAFGLARDDESRKPVTVREPMTSPVMNITSPQTETKLTNLISKNVDPPTTHRYREDPRKYDRNVTEPITDSEPSITTNTTTAISTTVTTTIADPRTQDVEKTEKVDKFELKPNKFDMFESKFDTKGETKFDKNLEKFDTKFESKLDTKFDSKFDPKLESKFDSKLESKFESKFDSKFESKLDSKFDANFDAKYDPKFDSKFDSKYDSKLEPKFDSKYDSKLDSKYDSKYDSKLEPKYDSKLEPKFDSKLEPKFDSKLESKFDSKFESKFDKFELKSKYDKPHHKFDQKLESSFEKYEKKFDPRLDGKFEDKLEKKFESCFEKKSKFDATTDKYYTKNLYLLTDNDEMLDKRYGKEKGKKYGDSLKDVGFRSSAFSDSVGKVPRLSPDGFYSNKETEEFGITETTHFIPPFNNPVYPNSTQFTGFPTSIMDTTSPYEGRNPSPPPSSFQDKTT